MTKKLTSVHSKALLLVLKTRFESNQQRHKGISWTEVETRLLAQPHKLWSLQEMERTGGEPDVIAFDTLKDVYIFCDCSAESPAGRRSLCYDLEGWKARKEHRPIHNALDAAKDMGVELMTEAEYRSLQLSGTFDTKTSSWIHTPPEIRKLGGALFAEFRYGNIFVYHNSAPSYYVARGFRATLKV